MATRQTKTKESELPETSDDALRQAISLLTDDTFNAESLSPALQQLYTEMGVEDGEATVHVTKLNAGSNGTEAHVWKGPPEDYDLERIARQFGSGDYRVKVYARAQTGQRALRGNRVFSWLLSPEEEERRRNPGSTAAPQINPSDLTRAIAEAVRAAIPPQPVAPPVDPFAQMKQMAEIMALMRPEAPQTPQHDPLVIMERVLQMQTMMRESMPERDDTPAPGNANTNDLLLGVIKSFGPMFGQVLMANAGGAQQAQANEPAPQLAHVPQPVATIPQAPQPTTATEDDVNFKLKMGMNFLVMQCDAGGEPITYAEVVIDSVPAETLEMLVNDANAINTLIALDKRIEEPKRKEWFENLLKEVKHMITEEGGENASPV